MASSDRTLRRLARKILTDGIRMKKGETLTVETWANGLQFASHLVAEARAMGVAPVTLFEDESAYVEGVRRSPEDQLGVIGRHEYALLAASDGYVFVPNSLLGPYAKKLNPGESAKATAYNSSWYDAAEKAGLRGARMSWGFVGPELARILGKTVAQVVDHLVAASFVDCAALSRAGARLVDQLGDGSTLKLETGGATLTMKAKRAATVEDGTVDAADVRTGENMAYWPPGMVTKQIDKGSVTGSVTVGPSLTRLGVIRGATLKFKGGEMKAWKAARAADGATMSKLIEAVPEERRSVSTLVVGLNPKMKFGFGQDRFVAGSVVLAGFGFLGVARRASLSSDEKPLVVDGRISAAR